MIEEETIRSIVTRLARPSGSGTHIVERAALLAEGPDCAQIEGWILRVGGEPCGAANVSRGRGLHAERADARSPTGVAPSRYLLPTSALDARTACATDPLDDRTVEAAGVEPAGPEQTGAMRR